MEVTYIFAVAWLCLACDNHYELVDAYLGDNPKSEEGGKKCVLRVMLRYATTWRRAQATLEKDVVFYPRFAVQAWHQEPNGPGRVNISLV